MITDTPQLLAARVIQTLDKLWSCLEGLSDNQVRWQPCAETNSLSVLVKHVLGATKETLDVLWCRPSLRQRQEEFLPVTREELNAYWVKERAVLTQELQSLSAEVAARIYVHPRKRIIHPNEDNITGINLLLDLYAHAQEHLGEAKLTRTLLKTSDFNWKEKGEKR